MHNTFEPVKRGSLPIDYKYFERIDWSYQNEKYKSGMIFDFFACGPAQNPKNKHGESLLKGAYPAGFLQRLKDAMGNQWPKNRRQILHVCAGSVDKTEGITLDNDKQFKPDILSDAETFSTKFLKRYRKVRISIADPPYNDTTAIEYYDEVQKLSVIRMLKQMVAVTEDSGFVILLDQTSPSIGPHIPELKRVALIGVTSVPNTDIRLCTVWRKKKNDNMPVLQV